MAFQRDEKFAAEIGPAFGEYLTSFVSEPQGHARADLFRSGRFIIAYITFPTGMRGSDIDEPYFGHVRDFIRQQGVGEHSRIYNT